jgi:hypothetical protein
MAILTGRSGQFFVDGVRVARCTGWELDESRPMLEGTPVNSWSRTYVPGRREGSGSASLLYDPDDAAAVALFSSVLATPPDAAEIALEAVLDGANGVSYPITMFVSSASHAVAKGSAQQRDITFRVSDVGIELQIVGANRALPGVTQLYAAQVFGLSGGWSYLWGITAGPTIADPTAQSTEVTFNAVGTYLLTVTATLGAISLTEDLLIEAVDYPRLWISRSTSAKSAPNPAAYNGLAAFDTANDAIYHCAIASPDVGVGPVGNIIAKFDYEGNRITTKRVNGLGSVDFFCSCIQPLSNGDLLIAFDQTNEQIWMRVTSDLSSIVWQKKMAGLTASRSMNWGCYDDVSQRLFFNVWGGTPGFPTDYIGYVNTDTGTVTMLDVSPSPLLDITAGRPIRLASGKILYVYGKAQGVVFMECNNDLKVGGSFGPIKTVEHNFTGTAYNSRVDAVETDNYIAVIGAADIGIFAKSNYAHVRTIRRSSATGEQVVDFYNGGELVVACASGTSIRVLKIDEALTGFTSQVVIGPTGGGAVVVPARSNQQCPGGTAPACDPALGLFAYHQHQTSFASGVGEMLTFARSTYSSDATLSYGPFSDAITVETPIGLTTLTPTGTFNRSYSFALYSPPALTTPTVSLVTESTMTFSTYVLA